MTDRGLLELAAKAAGIEITFAPWPMRFVDAQDQKKAFTVRWNPLDDDGDALRLAVKLGIPLEFCHASGIVTATDPWSALAFDEPPAGDSYASARLAIVRAAAQIAREAS